MQIENYFKCVSAGTQSNFITSIKYSVIVSLALNVNITPHKTAHYEILSPPRAIPEKFRDIFVSNLGGAELGNSAFKFVRKGNIAGNSLNHAAIFG